MASLDVGVYVPLNFFDILRYPNELPDLDWDENIAKFHGYKGSTTLHVTSFMKSISDLDVVHKDVIMKMFVYSLENEAVG